MTEKQYPELPDPTAWRSYDNLLKRARYDAVPITSTQPGIYSHTRMFTEDQTRAFADATCAMRALQAAPAAVAEPVAWLHDDPQRYDVIHAEIKDLLVKYRDAAGYLHRPFDKSAHYTIPLYTAPAPAAQGDALDQGVREELSIGKAINRAARDLPEGWEIRIDLERDAGVVHLTDPEGNETMSEGGELFSDQINAAIELAHGIKPKEQSNDHQHQCRPARKADRHDC